MTREELIEQVNQLNWVHTIDLGNGVMTPGMWGGGNPAIMRALDDLDFSGKKVLDIGCWDGQYSFLAEKRGAAEVYATDLISQRTYMLPTFELAHTALNSQVKYYPHISVYDVGELGIKDFDIVIYCGVYYHIKDPLRSFTALRKVMADGGQIVVEGAVIKTPPRTTGSPAAEDCYARYYYREQFCGDDSNWWVPTIPCLHQWVESSYFRVEKDYGLTWPEIENTRYTLTAKAVRLHDPVFIRPDPELAEFDPGSESI
jgi:tRNA (mo5U34)-methyltransferase